MRNVVNGPGTAGGDGRAVDFAFLRAQTFGDDELEREILDLFLAQARDLVPRLPAMPEADRVACAHRLKGSCLGIGAHRAAAAADAYCVAGSSVDRERLHEELTSAFAAAEEAIMARRSAT